MEQNRSDRMNRKRNENTNRNLWIAFLAIVFLAACSGNPSLRKIEKESDNPKLAAAVLHRTDSILACGSLSDEEEGRMLLAKAKAQFFLNYMTQSFPPRLDSVITTAVQKLERHDSPKLAESYYWQGMISNLCYGKPVEGMVALENALLILPDADPEFRARLYQQLSTVYEQLGNFDMAVRYMQQMVRLMDSRDDPVGQLVTHYDISTIFRQNGQKDSADYYLQLAIRERAKFNDHRFDIFNEVFGSYYLEQNDLPKAKYYLSHALMADGRMPDAQLGLARIAWMEHRPADAQRCLQRAVTLADSLYRADGSYRTPMVSFLRSLARFYSDTGAKDEELHTRRQLDTVGTSLARHNARLLNEASVQERDYLARKLEQENQRQNRLRMTFAGIVVLLAGGYVFLLARRYIRRSRERLGKLRRKTYRQTHEIGKLKGQVKEYSKTQADRIIDGKPLYESIERGTATMEGWDKDTQERYICYARFIDPDIFATLSEKLTAKPTIFFYLWKKGYNDAEIARIMNVSNGSICTMRYNIRRQKQQGDDTNISA